MCEWLRWLIKVTYLIDVLGQQFTRYYIFDMVENRAWYILKIFKNIEKKISTELERKKLESIFVYLRYNFHKL